MRTLTGIFLTLVLIIFFGHCSKDIPEKEVPGTIDKDTLEAFVPKEHPIQVQNDGGEAVFWNTDNDSIFVPRGVNYFWIVSANGGYQDRFFGLGIFDRVRIRADFRSLKENGFNVVRIFFDSCNDDPICIGNPEANGLNGSYIDNIVTTMEIAKEEGLFLMLTSNDLPGQGGYWDMVDRGVNDNFGPYRNANYLTGSGVEAAVTYWGDVMRALADRDAPFESVFAWSLLNEQWYITNEPPFSLSSGMVTCANGNTYDMGSQADKKAMAVEGMEYYIRRIRDTIDNYDPNALVTMGFFVPDYPNPMRAGDFRYVETAGLLNTGPLDFFDFHAYPGVEPLGKIAENFGMIGYTSKPVIMGEFGAFLNNYSDQADAIDAIQAWMAESCQYGFDGWIYWGLYRAPIGIGDATWGFMDNDREIMDAMAPVNFPDACDPSLLPPRNIAVGALTDASAFLSDQTPGMAVDNDLSTQWGSGDYAPQWLKIDLGSDHPVGTIKLHVAQYPAGITVHKLEAGSTGRDWVTLDTFSGNTKDGDVLSWTSDGGTESYRFIIITTGESPSWVSWREVEVFEDILP